MVLLLRGASLQMFRVEAPEHDMKSLLEIKAFFVGFKSLTLKSFIFGFDKNKSLVFMFEHKK